MLYWIPVFLILICRDGKISLPRTSVLVAGGTADRCLLDKFFRDTIWWLMTLSFCLLPGCRDKFGKLP